MARAQRRRARGERGAILVELAMVTPLLVMLVMGIVDFGMMFSERISLQGGVREAGWNASRGMLGSADGCTLTFVGPAPSAATQRVMCLAKDRSELDEADFRVKVRLVNLDYPATPGTGAVGEGIMVCVMRPARSTTGFFSLLLDSRVQQSRLTNVIIAADPANPIVTAEEQPLPGRSWSWCDPSQPAPS